MHTCGGPEVVGVHAERNLEMTTGTNGWEAVVGKIGADSREATSVGGEMSFFALEMAARTPF